MVYHVNLGHNNNEPIPSTSYIKGEGQTLLTITSPNVTYCSFVIAYKAKSPIKLESLPLVWTNPSVGMVVAILWSTKEVLTVHI